MKKSMKIFLHAIFWLAFPLVNTFAKWADAHDSFPGFGSEPKPGFFQILHDTRFRFDGGDRDPRENSTIALRCTGKMGRNRLHQFRNRVALLENVHAQPGL